MEDKELRIEAVQKLYTTTTSEDEEKADVLLVEKGSLHSVLLTITSIRRGAESGLQ